MVISIYRSRTGWSFAGPGPETRVKLPRGAAWLPVRGLGLCLFVPVERRVRAEWSAARVAAEVEAGNLKTVTRKAAKAG